MFTLSLCKCVKAGCQDGSVSSHFHLLGFKWRWNVVFCIKKLQKLSLVFMILYFFQITDAHFFKIVQIWIYNSHCCALGANFCHFIWTQQACLLLLQMHSLHSKPDSTLCFFFCPINSEKAAPSRRSLHSSQVTPAPIYSALFTAEIPRSIYVFHVSSPPPGVWLGVKLIKVSSWENTPTSTPGLQIWTDKTNIYVWKKNTFWWYYHASISWYALQGKVKSFFFL